MNISVKQEIGVCSVTAIKGHILCKNLIGSYCTHGQAEDEGKGRVWKGAGNGLTRFQKRFTFHV